MVIWLPVTLMAWCLTSIVVAFFAGRLLRIGLASAQPTSPAPGRGGSGPARRPSTRTRSVVPGADELTCRPGSVPAHLTVSRWATIHLGPPLPAASCDLPASSDGQPSPALTGGALAQTP